MSIFIKQLAKKQTLSIFLRVDLSFLQQSKTLVSLANRAKIHGIANRYVTRITQRDIRLFIDYLNTTHPSIQIRFLDIGARGGLAKAHIFAPLRWVKNKIIHAVEPEEEEAHRLLQSGEYDHIYTEAVGAHTGSATLYLPKSKACASLRTVDPAIAAAINFDESMWKQPQKITISVKTLADLLDPSCSYDFIKMILMGSDHDVLVSANESLFLHGIGIYCEARSVPLFQGMHTIEETTDFLKKKDFFLLQVRNFDAFFFNTIYTKNPVQINTLEQVLKHCLLGFLSQHPYYIYAVLKHYEEKNGTQKILDPVFRILGIPRS